MLGLINQGGVVAWSSVVYDSLGRINHDTVASATYDAARGIWAGPSSTVDGGLLNLFDQGGVVAWSSVVYDSLGRINHDTVAYTTYDTARGIWVTQSSTVVGTLVSLTDQNGVVTWTSSGSRAENRIYDRPSGTWKKV